MSACGDLLAGLGLVELGLRGLGLRGLVWSERPLAGTSIVKDELVSIVFVPLLVPILVPSD